ncbi:MAG TPA: hypothetical protein VE127_05410, partial [Solirubrobacteraceae bacterium]|nr:hypothetical protein [Solirubrobacteraceae bacterium]
MTLVVMLAMMVPVLAHLPRLSSSLDPLIAEAKRRARRRVLGALLVLVAAGAIAAVVWLRSPADPWAQIPVGRFGIVRIPGMKEVASDRSTLVCGGTGLRSAYCDPGAPVRNGVDQTWVVTAIAEQYGAR